MRPYRLGFSWLMEPEPQYLPSVERAYGRTRRRRRRIGGLVGVAQQRFTQVLHVDGGMFGRAVRDDLKRGRNLTPADKGMNIQLFLLHAHTVGSRRLQRF